MRTYTELTHSQRKSAFNYHLNDLMDLDAPDYKKEVASIAWEARGNAKSSLYGNDPATGILPVLFTAVPLLTTTESVLP